MADVAELPNPTAPAPSPMDRMHDWVMDTFGIDPRSFPPAAAAQATPAPPTSAPPVAAAAAPPPPAPTAPPQMTPDEARADLQRRLKVSGAIYAQYGQVVADDMVPVKDRLTPAEAKIGGAVVERDKDVTLDGKDSRTTVDERGITVTSKSSAGVTTIGADGKPDEFTRERTTTTNIGLGNASQTVGSKMTIAGNGTTTVIAEQTTKAVDLVKGEASVTDVTSREVKDSKGTTRETEKTATTVGMSGFAQTNETSKQTGKNLDSTSNTVGVSRNQGQLGVNVGQTTKSGQMTGPAEAQVMEKGTETTQRAGGGIVSDDKGTGVGVTGSRSQKTLYGDGKSVTNTTGGGGKCQALVKEIPGSDPPRFTITTTITFDFSTGKSGTKELAQPTPLAANAGPDTKAGPETTHKGSVTVGANVAVNTTASFKHELTQDEAHEYLECIKQNGRGSKLPEHQILATGMAQGWQAAHELWGELTGSPDHVKALKPGEELETSFQSNAGVKAGVSGSETRQGGLALGAEAAASETHRISIKKTGMPDGKIQVTATVDDGTERSAGASGSYGVANATHGASHGEGTGRAIVFMLDPKQETFAEQLKTIDHAQSADELDALAKDPSFQLVSRTEKDSASDGVTDGAGIGLASLSLTGKGTIQNEVTRDAQGNVLSSKSVATSQVGGTLGVGPDLKVGDSVTESFTGEVRGGKASGEIAQAHRSTSVSKTLANLVNAKHDVLGAVLNPGKLMAETVDTAGTDFGDTELMGICQLAVDKTKWNSQVGGMRQDDWIATGEKIRAAIKSSHGEIVDVDKTAVEKALAEWTKATDGGRTEVLDRIVRPFGGDSAGKAFAFPDGTEQFKPLWDSLVIGDPLAGPRAKAKTDPTGAVADLHGAMKQLASLQKSVKGAAAKWAGFEVQHAEMLGHINSRINEANKAILEIGKGHPATGHTGHDAAKDEQEGAEALKIDLETYNNNLDQMKTFAEAVFGKLWQAEQKLKEHSLFSGSGLSNTIEAAPWIKEAADEIKLWDGLYWPTYKLWEKLSPTTNLDKAALEKLHVHGAHERWKEVNELAHKV